MDRKDERTGKRNPNWTQEEIQFLRDNFQKYTRKQLAELLGRTEGAVRSKATKQLKLKKTPEAMAKIYKRPNKGCFKKGNKPGNWTEVGTIRRRTHQKRGYSYWWIKFRDKKVKHPNENWMMLHVYLWEQENGPVPENHVVLFKDRNPDNCVIENLELISKVDHIQIARESDQWIASSMARGKGRVIDQELRELILEDPDLIELKRKQLQLNHKLNQYEKHDNRNERL